MMLHLSMSALLAYFALAGPVPEGTSAPLPMDARTNRPGVPVYSAPDTYERYASIQEEDQRLGIWESQGIWLRITPPDFTPEGWVEVSDVKLDPSGTADPGASYLTELQEDKQEYIARRTVTACAVVLKPITYFYNSPSGEKRSGHLNFAYEPGEVLAIYRQSGELHETRPDPNGDSVWLTAEFFELSPPFPEEGSCLHDFGFFKHSYTSTRSGKYWKGPSDKLPLVGLFKDGQEIDVSHEYAGGWLGTNYHTLGLVWFQAGDTVPTEQEGPAVFSGAMSKREGFPVSAYTPDIDAIQFRSFPDDTAPVLWTNDTPHPYLILFEKRKGWYRVTPSDFTQRHGFLPHSSIATMILPLIARPLSTTSMLSLVRRFNQKRRSPSLMGRLPGISRLGQFCCCFSYPS